jgi:integrase/recombinase XerC
MEQWLRSLSHGSRRKYLGDLKRAARYFAKPTPAQLVVTLSRLPRAKVLVQLEAFRDDLIEAGLASATINGNLCAINSALRALARADIGPGPVDIVPVRHEQRRDTKGPGLVKMALLLEKLSEDRTPLGIRDRAIINLGAQRGLRSCEISRLRLRDLLLDTSEIRVLRKGHRERSTIKIARATVRAIRDWLEVRATLAGAHRTEAVFLTIGGGSVGNAVTTDRILRIVKSRGSLIGGAWRPHGLRHSAITTVLKRTNNMEAARVFAGHISIATTQRYIDNTDEWESVAVEAMQVL